MNRLLYTGTISGAVVVTVVAAWLAVRPTSEPVTKPQEIGSAQQDQIVAPPTTNAIPLSYDPYAVTWYNDTAVEIGTVPTSYTIGTRTEYYCSWSIDAFKVKAGPAITTTAAERVNQKIQAFLRKLQQVHVVDFERYVMEAKPEAKYAYSCKERAGSVRPYTEDFDTEIQESYNRVPLLSIVAQHQNVVSGSDHPLVAVDAITLDVRTGEAVSPHSFVKDGARVEFYQRLAKALVKDFSSDLFGARAVAGYPVYARENIQQLKKLAQASQREAQEVVGGERPLFLESMPVAIEEEGVVFYFPPETLADRDEEIVSYLFPYTEWVDLMTLEAGTIFTPATR